MLNSFPSEVLKVLGGGLRAQLTLALLLPLVMLTVIYLEMTYAAIPVCLAYCNVTVNT